MTLLLIKKYWFYLFIYDELKSAATFNQFNAFLLNKIVNV